METWQERNAPVKIVPGMRERVNCNDIMLNTYLPTPRVAIAVCIGRRKRASKSLTRRPVAIAASLSPSAPILKKTFTTRINAEAETTTQITGVAFQPFTEVQVELAAVDKTTKTESFARSEFAPECEAALNEQINVEYNISIVYHALFAFFDRDNVGLPGLAEFFKQQSLEEREHAEMCMKYQNMRGGRVKLQAIASPLTEFDHKEKGDALYAMELALSLEKLNFQKLRDLWQVADKSNDPQMCDFIEAELMKSQIESIKQISEYVSQLRRVGQGHGVFHFDRVFHNGAH